MYEDIQMRSLACRALAVSQPKPLAFLDIGAGGGLSEVWRYCARLGAIKAYGVDPNAAECQRLARTYPYITFLPVALGARAERRTYYQTIAPAVSSLLEPNQDLLCNYPTGGTFQVVGTGEVELTTIDALVAAGTIQTPDFLKIDTQGFELEVLKGAEASLAGVTGIELETQFRPLYKGQPLFPEIHAYLYERGFILRDLQQNPYACYEGELIEMNAFFSRPYTTSEQNFLKRMKVWEFATEISSPTFAAQEKLRGRTLPSAEGGLTMDHFNRLLGEYV